MADYAGSRRATEKESKYFETWVNGAEWNSSVQDNLNAPNKRRWPKTDVTVHQIMRKMWEFMLEKGYVKATGMRCMFECFDDYKKLRNEFTALLSAEPCS